MIFQHTISQVLDGTKTETRRLVKRLEDGTFVPRGELLTYPGGIPTVVVNGTHLMDKRRVKWQVGKTYAVQPGRGQKAVGRIRITAIRQERLQDISKDDAVAEGCHESWWGREDYERQSARSMFSMFSEVWDDIHTKPNTRWNDNPLVWALQFELVGE